MSSMCPNVTPTYVCVSFILHYMQLGLHKPLPSIVLVYHTTEKKSLSSLFHFIDKCNFGPEDKSNIVPYDMQEILSSIQKIISRNCSRRKNEGIRSYGIRVFLGNQY